jgi:hypothetical protein
MHIIRDEVLKKILNASALKKVIILSFVRSRKNGVTMTMIENHWSDHEFGRPLTKTAKDGKRVVDNTVRNVVEQLVKDELIEKDNDSGRNIYFYREETDELAGRLMEADSIPDLLRWAVTFSKYKGLPFFDDLLEPFEMSYEELLDTYSIDPEELKPIIEFETAENVYTGWTNNAHQNDITENVTKHLRFFYDVISITKETVEFTYRSFQTGKIEKVSDLEPYLLKEHNKRWYLIAFDPRMNCIRPFSLDRIIDTTDKYSSRPYRIPVSFDSRKHWRDCIGIYTHPEAKVSEVSFELKNGPKYNNINYLVSLPMHTSQKAFKVDDVWTRFEYKIQIGPEVVRHIRQWGLGNVRNILPEELDEDVRRG